MVLVDTSVWADHFRRTDQRLQLLLGAGRVVIHPFVVGELSLGNLRPWTETVNGLRALPSTGVVDEEQLLALIADHDLAGSGLNFVDAHLLAVCKATSGPYLWSRDKRLAARADAAGLAWAE